MGVHDLYDRISYMSEQSEFLNEYISGKLEELEGFIRFRAEEKNVLIAIDGRCASGKSTFAAMLAKRLDCPLVHMDDFFLRPQQRTKERYEEPGGNVDYERVRDEVLTPLSEGRNAVFQRFDCSVMRLGETIEIPCEKMVVVEGSYSMHPVLRHFYDVKVFMDIDSEEQLARIEARNGKEKLEIFKEKWIPLEEKYFTAFHIADAADDYINESMPAVEP